VTFARRPRRFVTWLALVAMLALALMPTLSHAMAQARGASVFDEICSSAGPKPVDPAQGVAFGHLDHCPFCHLQAQPFAPPPAPQALVLLPAAHEAPALFFSAARTLFAWRSAQPRAPPLVS
jgi:hypothetical protein